MTLFINLDTMEYPRFDGDVALEPTANWSEVIEVNSPVTADDEISYNLAPELKDGSYWQVWAVRKLTEEELKPLKIGA
jgi:hypothetical protein